VDRIPIVTGPNLGKSASLVPVDEKVSIKDLWVRLEAGLEEIVGLEGKVEKGESPGGKRESFAGYM
jgi:hypothetical protein